MLIGYAQRHTNFPIFNGFSCLHLILFSCVLSSHVSVMQLLNTLFYALWQFLWSRTLTFQKKKKAFMKALYNWWKIFVSSWKLFSFSRYLSFCRDFLVMQKKRLNYEDKANFKIFGLTTWLTNSYKVHIAQFLPK